MHYRLSFFDDDGDVRDVCAADIATEDMAIHWMRIVGAAWARHGSRQYDWSRMELWCQGRCIARAQATRLDSLPGRTRQPVESGGRREGLVHDLAKTTFGLSQDRYHSPGEAKDEGSDAQTSN
jgi:hypothetical protein